MKFNKKYCLLFLMTILVLLLGAGMVSASEAGDNVEVIKDNNGLSTPDNYDVDKVVQSDLTFKSDANVEKTSTKYDNKFDDTKTDTFVNQTDTNDNQTITSKNGHSVNIVEDSTVDGKLNNILNPGNSGLIQESEDVIQLSTSTITMDVTSSEKMTPTFTEVEEIDNDSNGIKKTSQITEVKTAEGDDSDERYRVVLTWSGANWNPTSSPYTYKWPWLMNDTTWVYGLKVYSSTGSYSQNINPEGYYSSTYPSRNVPAGIYKRTNLTYQTFINDKTKEDVLPYIRTFIYNHYNDTNIPTSSSYGTKDLHLVIDSFVSASYDYRNSTSYLNTKSIGSNTVWDYVNETIELVNNGQGVNNSGKFGDSDFLTYQFYYYEYDPELNNKSYIPLIGFNVLTNVNITKQWKNDSSVNRPENVTVMINANGRNVRNVTLTESDDWTTTVTDLPVYDVTNADRVLEMGADYNISSTTEDVIDLKVQFTPYNSTYSNTVYYNLYANDNLVWRSSSYSYRTLSKTNGVYTATLSHLTKYDVDGNPYVYTVKEVNSRSPYGVLDDENKHGDFTVEKINDDYSVKHFNVTINNTDLIPPSGNVNIRLYNENTIIYTSPTASNWGNGPVLKLGNQTSSTSEEDLIVVYNYPKVNTINYTVDEVIYDYNKFIESEYVDVNPTMYGKMHIETDMNPVLKNVTLTNTYFEPPVDIRTQYGLKYVIWENTTVSNETYSVICDWSKDDYGCYSHPWLMNDSSWVYCIEPGAVADPDGYDYGLGPGVVPSYRRITLTDNEKIIHPLTGEDILPFLRTMIYYYTLYPEEYNILISRSGTPTFDALIEPFVYGSDGNYRNPEIIFNRRNYNGRPVWTYTEKILEMVDSGNAIPSSGVFNNSDYLTYQFYMYSDNQNYSYRYQNIIGFHVLTKINVTKQWDDDDSSAYQRPESVEVQLNANGEPVGSPVVLNKTNNWTYTYTELPVYNIYNYTKTLSNDEYSLKINENNELMIITYQKVWDESYTGIKPSRINFTVFGDGKVQGSSSLYSSRNYRTVLGYYPKYDDNGNEIEYSVLETDDYADYGDITLTPQSMQSIASYNITVSDELKSDDNIFVVLENGNKLYQMILSSNNDWNVLFFNEPEDLDKYEYSVVQVMGARINIINYTIDEVDVPSGYKSVIENTTVSIHPLMTSKDQDSNNYVKYLDEDLNKLLTNVTVTNTYDFTIRKVWDDLDNQDLIRPDNITVNIIASNGFIKQVVLNKSNNWTVTLRDLPQYNGDGSLIEYTVEEAEIPEGYTSKILIRGNDYKITNSHIPRNFTLNVTKIWDDDNNINRPENLTIILLANGQKYDTLTLNASNNWIGNFTNLPEYINGVKINYTINEIVPDGYKVEYGEVIPIINKKDTYIQLDLLNLTDMNYNTTSLNGTANASFNIIVRDKYNIPVTDGEIKVTDGEGNIIYAGKLNDGAKFINIPVTLSNQPAFWGAHPLVKYNLTVDYYENELYHNSSRNFLSINESITTAVTEDRYFNLSYVNNTLINDTHANVTFKMDIKDSNRDNITTARVVITNRADRNIVYDDEVVNGTFYFTMTVKINEFLTEDHSEFNYSFYFNIKYSDEKMPVSIERTISMPFTEPYKPTTYIEKLLTNQYIGYRDNGGYAQMDAIYPYAPFNMGNETYAFCIEPSVSGSPRVVFYNPDYMWARYVKIAINDETKIGNNLYSRVNLTLDEYALEYMKLFLYNHRLDSDNFNIYYGENQDDIQNMIHLLTGLFTLNGTNYESIEAWIPNVETKLGKTYEYFINETKFLFSNGTMIDSHGVYNFTKDGHWEYQFYLYYPYNQLFSDNGYSLQPIFNTKTQKCIGIEYYFVPNENILVTNLTNTILTSINVTKDWNDTADIAGIRPDNITVGLFNGDELVDYVVLNESNKWYCEFNNLDKYDENHDLIKYSVREIRLTETIVTDENGTRVVELVAEDYVPEGYTLSVVDNTTGSLVIRKVWAESVDSSDLPENVTIEVYANDKNIQNVTLTAANNWTVVVDNQPKCINDTLVVYTIKENGTLSTIELTYNTTSYIFTNTHEIVNINVTKVWNDSEDIDGLRPQNVTIMLLANGEQYGESVTLDQSNNWSYVFINLPVYINGTKIVYTVNETPVPEYYNVSYNITRHNESKLKTFIDVELLDLDVPNNKVTIGLLITDSEGNYVKDGNVIIYNDDGEIINTITLTGKREYIYWDLNEDIIFDVQYNPSDSYLESYVSFNESSLLFDFVSGFQPWLFSDGSYVYCLNPGGYADPDSPVRINGVTIYPKYGKKLFDNEEIISPVTGENVLPYIRTLLLNHADENEYIGMPPWWTEGSIQMMMNIFLGYHNYDYRNSETYVDEPLSNGKTFSYYINETIQLVNEGKGAGNTGITNISDDGYWIYKFYYYSSEFNLMHHPQVENYWQHMIGYNLTFVSNVLEDKISITNTHEQELISLNVTKIWNDSDNQDGIRPENITIGLFNDTGLVDYVVLKESSDVSENWTHTFIDLPKYVNGGLINYTVDEINVTVKTETENDVEVESVVTEHYVPEGYSLEIAEVSEHNFTLINNHVTDKTNITVVKIWTDDNDKVNIRPPNIVVQLYANGEAFGDEVVLSGDDWKYDFVDLDMYYNQGIPIEYTVKEIVPNNYTESYNYSVDVTISHVATLISDDGSLSATINLLADGEEVDTVDISDIYGDWTHSFTDLPVYNDEGKFINYTISELDVEYNISFSYTFSINNTINGTTNINVTKIWNDANNNDGKRPNSVNVTLVIDGVVSDIELQLNETENWMGNFTDLPMYHNNGTLIVYNVTEVDTDESVLPEGYELTDIVFCEGRFKVINTYIPENITINVTKVWTNDTNHDGKFPANVTVKLLQNGEEYRVAVLNASDDWKYTFTNLPKYYIKDNVNGTEYEYSIVEIAVSGYDTEVIPTDDGFIVNNTYVPEYISINVTKVWNDSDNQDMIRPHEITVNLYGIDKKTPYKTTTMSGNDDTWYAEFTELPKYYNGVEINYTLEEDLGDLAENYTSNITQCNGNVVVVNTHIPELVNITVYKAWNDSDNRDGLRPGNVTVNLLVEGNVVRTGVISNDTWSYTFTDLDKYDGNAEIVYTIMEVNVPAGYTVFENNTNFTLINTHELITKNISVVKVWDDVDTNKDRPENVTVFLIADNEAVANVTLSEENGWNDTFTDLKVFRNGSVGEEIVYTIQELEVDNYNTGISNIGDNFTITNTHIPELVNVTVNKVWDDNDNQDGLRSNVTIILRANGVPVENGVVQVNSTDDWNYTFYDLPKYDNGEIVDYAVEEVNVPTGYNVTIEGLNITNTHIPEVISINVSKVWDDANNTDGMRPDDITIHLFADGTEINSTVLNESNGWKDSFTNLPKFSSGTEIVYTVSEDVDDTYTSELVNCNGTYKFINTHVPELVNVTVYKVWDDNDNQDKMRPTQVTIRLKSSDGKQYVAVMEGVNGKWNYTFTDLPKYSKGAELAYSVEEVIVPTGYNVSYSEDNLTITNTHELVTKNITVVKVWDDNDNNDDVRPTEVEVDLYADDAYNQTVTIKGDDWTYTFTNLTVYRFGKVGEEIVYTIKEHEVTNYTSIVSNIGDYFTVINTHNDSLINLTINKVWEDSNNNDNIRPENVTVRLLANGTEYKIVVVSGDEWTYTFTDLPEYNNGTKVIYTIEEVNVPAGYTASVDGTTITNTHDNITKSINVSKVWNDNNNNDNARTSVVVELLANGEVVNTTTLNESNGWKATFDNLPVNKDGKPVDYNISEVKVDHYITNITECNGNFIISNTLVPELVNITVNKVWNDSDNLDNIRPDEVTLKLKANGQEYVVKVVKSEGNTWTYTFTDLPKYSNGQEIVYTVEEVNIAKGYIVSYGDDNLTVINTHVPEETEVNVTKVWNDADNNDGKRPDSVTVELRADGTVVDTFELSEGNCWKHTFSGLVKYAAGHEIVYTISEDNVPTDYTVDIVFCEGVFKVINTHLLENTSISVSKVWDDSENQDKIRPDSIFVQIYADGKEYKLVKLTSENGWTDTITGLPKYSNGVEVVYNIGESSVPDGYTASVDGLTITNTHVTETTTVNVSKVWNDNNNNDGTRPSSVSVNLYADGVKINSTVLNADNEWKFTFDNLPVNKNGTPIVYTVDEDEVDGYSSMIVNCNGTFKVINSHNASLINLTINKVWDDNNNNDGLRPATVSIRVLANGEEVKVIVVSGEEWTAEVTDLPEYINGNKIVYTIEEVEVPNGYTASVDGLTITNTHEDLLKEVNVTKVWNDANNNDGKRPSSVTVELLADGVIVNETVLSAGNGWKFTFDNLPVNKDGKAIVYTIGESSVPEGYTVTIKNCEGVFKVINSYIPENTSISVNKVWEDNNNQDAIRPDSIFVQIYADGKEYKLVKLTSENGWTDTITGLPKYSNGVEVVYTIGESDVPDGYTATVDGLTITNTHVTETTTVNVSKIWNDNNNNDGVRPASVTVNLYADGIKVNSTVLSEENGWKDTFTDLAVNKEGKVIIYTVSEEAIENYTSMLVNCNGTFKFINSHNISTVELNITKVWEDNENQDNIRPENVTVEVLANGDYYDIVVINSTNNWKYTITDLPEFINGQTVVYTIREIRVENGYTSTVEGLTITNTHIPELTNVSVVKVWNDVDNNDGKRPSSVTVELLADGVKVNETVLSADNGWKFTFDNLPVNKDGKAIVYTIGESSVPEGYTVTIKNCEGEFKVINSYIPENTSISVNKVWKDADNQDGNRPSTVTVKVLADGTVVQTAVVTEADGWTYIFRGLPKYSNGQEIVYTVEEVVPAGYTVSYNGSEITNTYVPATTSVNVTKVWNDNNNNDGKRPSSVTVNLYAGGNKVDSAVLSADNNWKTTFDNLPVNNDGKEITYTVSEDQVESYTTELVNCNGTFKFINTHNDSTVELNITKVWEDNDNQDAIRPATITVRLLADGVEYDIIIVKADDDWNATFTNLPEFNNGNKVVYTIEEVEVPSGYTASVDGTTIINTHEVFTKEVNVTKVWNDTNNNDNVRPAEVIVNLYADGNKVETTTLSADNDWKATFENLPVNKDGKAIIYTISEEAVNNYTSVIVDCNGTYKVINTHNCSTIELNITKVWIDANNQDAIRPNNVTIEVLANGERFDIVVINSTNGWKYTLKELPEFLNGETIEYTIKEISVPAGYTSDVDGTTIINTHEVFTKEVNVIKVWDDNNNNDGVRPDSVTVNLFADENLVDSAVLSADNDWKFTFDNLPVNKDGKEITYTVSEEEIPDYTTTVVNCNGTFKVINSHNDSTTEITIVKEWDDNNNQDAIRPENVTVEVLANGDRYEVIVINSTSDWKITVENLPEFINGQKVNYTVREISAVTGYTSSVDGLTIKNTHVPITTEINVTKVWNDNSNNDGIRPESVTVNLVRGNEVVSSVTLNEDNGWMATFKDLPVYNNGEKIVYSIEEVAVEGYDVEVKDCCGNFELINSHNDSIINITINKVWIDNNNNDNIRPASITVRLLADTQEVDVAVVTGDDWNYTFENLPEYKDGNKIVYTIEEVNVPAGYVSSVDELTITNTHEDITKNITVTKVWNDSNNNDGRRPSSVVVHLLADGKNYTTATLNAGNNWKYTFENLPVNKDGKKIVYNISEEDVDPYVASITNSGDDFTVTNSYNITRINLTINKVWIDYDNNDNKRPESITVILSDENGPVKTVVVKDSDDWTYTFHDLPKYNNGHEIVYTIDEVPVADYNVTVNGLTITNTHEKITKDIEVSKVWNDCNNNDGVRPESVTVNLYADGQKVNSTTLTEADDWKYIFRNLPVYNAGNEIVYTIIEEAVQDYKVSYEGNVIINTHDLVNTSVTVTKVWEDNRNNDGIRPDSVSVNLYANGVKISSTLLSSNNSWTDTFDNLPKYKDGQIIVYTVSEDPVEGYNVTITGESNKFIIKNTHVIEKIKITIDKKWNDTDNLYGKRPVNVTVNVFANGTRIDSVVLSEDNDWKCELDNLPKYNNGELINYSVDEVNITYYHYSVKANGNYSFTVTNTLNKVRIFKWAWKLIGWNYSDEGQGEYNYVEPMNKQVLKKNAKSLGKGIGKYKPKYTPKKAHSVNKNRNKHPYKYRLSKEHYRLFIYLFKEYFYGDMSYSDFVAILKENGIQIDQSNAWNSDGTLIFDYDVLEDVPDSIELHDNGGHVKDSSDRVEKHNPRSNSGVIDSGEVEAKVVVEVEE